MKLKSQKNTDLRTQKIPRQVREISPLTGSKMRLSYLTEDKSELSPALRELLEASITLRTTSTKKLAVHLHRSPATIRAGFQRILTILGERNR